MLGLNRYLFLIFGAPEMNFDLKIPILLLTLLLQLQAEPSSFEIDRYGKRIQLDGFLVEWSQKTVKQWGNSAGSKWYWDAINTPEGLAGYVRSGRRVDCSNWVFSFEPQNFVMTVPEESTDSSLYRVDKRLYDSLGTVVLEWVIPWGKTGLDANGTYTVNLRGLSTCNDSLPALVLTGTREKNSGIVTPSVILRLLLIITLIIVYAVIYFRFRKRTVRKESPHL